MLYTYYLVEHRPMSEGGSNEFTSGIADLQDKPSMWSFECPYWIGNGRVSKEDECW